MLKLLRHMAFCCFGNAFPGLFLRHKNFFQKNRKLFPKSDSGASPIVKRFKAPGEEQKQNEMNKR